MEYTDQRQSEDNKINPLTIHYGAEGSSLACWIELKALSNNNNNNNRGLTSQW